MEPASLQQLFTSRAVIDLTWHFVPAWTLALLVGQHFRRSVITKSKPWSAIYIDGSQGWLVLPLLVWACLAAIRSLEFFDGPACDYGPPLESFLVIASSNLLAGCILCMIQVLAMGATSRHTLTLGLSGLPQFLSIAVIFFQALDSFLVIAIIAG